jgi:hypothetical protein
MAPQGEDQRKRRWIAFAVGVVLVLVIGGYIGWYKGFREVPQPDWVNKDPETRFKYASIGAEHDAGIPYWIFYVLPRMFPEKLPGPGATLRSAFPGSRARNCRSVSPKR